MSLGITVGGLYRQAYLKRNWSRRKLLHADITTPSGRVFDTDKMLAARVSVHLWSETTTMTEGWLYTNNQLLSDVGGHIGLMLGGSVLTIVELLDLLISYCASIRRRRRATGSVTRQFAPRPA